jgi:cephalosporin-C deacetylase-like acetyl esterase
MRFSFSILPLLLAAAWLRADDLSTDLRALDTRVLPVDAKPQQMLGADLRARRDAANRADREAWQRIHSRADWEAFRDRRLNALRASLGQFPKAPADLRVRVAKTLDGDGFRIENLVFESRPGLVVTANLYAPQPARVTMPGILICHSHHNGKTQGELQDMGMTWARLGCLVLVMDQLGHGERRQHPFRDERSYPRPFRVGRQDYFFRYNVGMQLQLAGESLIGWMVWDLMCGVDLLLSRPGIDKERIVLLGAVAGGGDPAAVTAALDPRIAAVVPFNFGGPQPETTYPLPSDGETSFNFVGGGSWESTRNLRRSASDGILPWVIVGSVAPRRLIYAHEFAWDEEHDPVWRRLNMLFGFYGAEKNLAYATGRGRLSGQPPESTHCNNIGPEHRKGIYAALDRWFNIPIPQKEYQQRRPAPDLMCLTDEIKPRPLHELAADLGAARTSAFRNRLAKLPPPERRLRLRAEWASLLGVPRLTDSSMPAPRVLSQAESTTDKFTVARVTLRIERDVSVPVLLLTPSRHGEERLPVVVYVAQEGKQRFLQERAAVIAGLLKAGVAVCLPDVRGTGETAPSDNSRGRSSVSTAHSSTALMLGSTLLGERLCDLCIVLDWLSAHPAVDRDRIALWGDSFARVNPPDRSLAVPLDADQFPHQAEPLGGLLAVFGALFRDHIRAVYVQGGLIGYQSVLESSFCYLPHDVIVPGALTAGDLGDVMGAVAPCPLRLEGLVDARNRQISAQELDSALEPAKTAYAATPHFLQFAAGRSADDRLTQWVITQLTTAR